MEEPAGCRLEEEYTCPKPARAKGLGSVFGLHPEEVAEFHEEAVPHPANIVEGERVGLGEAAPVAQEYHGAGVGPVGKEQVEAEIVHRPGGGYDIGAAAVPLQQEEAGGGIPQGVPLVYAVLA